jgi:hypothetical protein
VFAWSFSVKPAEVEVKSGRVRAPASPLHTAVAPSLPLRTLSSAAHRTESVGSTFAISAVWALAALPPSPRIFDAPPAPDEASASAALAAAAKPAAVFVWSVIVVRSSFWPMLASHPDITAWGSFVVSARPARFSLV